MGSAAIAFSASFYTFFLSLASFKLYCLAVQNMLWFTLILLQSFVPWRPSSHFAEGKGKVQAAPRPPKEHGQSQDLKAELIFQTGLNLLERAATSVSLTIHGQFGAGIEAPKLMGMGPPWPRSPTCMVRSINSIVLLGQSSRHRERRPSRSSWTAPSHFSKCWHVNYTGSSLGTCGWERIRQGSCVSNPVAFTMYDLCSQMVSWWFSAFLFSLAFPHLLWVLLLLAMGDCGEATYSRNTRQYTAMTRRHFK